MHVDDSHYWREELVRIAQTLKPKAAPPRWSARAQEVLARDIAIGFFVVRKLYEHNKLSSLTHYTDVHVLEYPLAVADAGTSEAPHAPSTGDGRHGDLLSVGTVSFWNKQKFLSHYDLARERTELCHFVDLADRFIHGYASILTRDSARNWSSVYLVADRRRNSHIWCISVADIAGVFMSVARDYPTQMVSFLGSREENRNQELRRDYYVLGWRCKRHRDRLRKMSRLIQNSNPERKAAVREISRLCCCSQGLVRRLHDHLLNWIPECNGTEPS